jgi:UDP-N-acetyl-2-amino-2-deoxyglucuronate dehydrogenase
MRLGVIGCGDITRFMLLMAKINRHIQITGCADIDIERAGKYASYFKGARAYDDYKVMIRDQDMDAVYLAVPHHLHHPMMKELIFSGIHILCEKPVATNLEDAVEIAELAKEHEIKVGINYQYRYDKNCYRMAAAARNGDLGQLYYGICNIPWHREDKYFTQSKWHSSKEQAGGGTLITQGSHALDLLLWSFGARPVLVIGATGQKKFSTVEVEDLCMAIVELENGCFLQVTSSMIASSEQPLSIHIYGSKGTAKYSGQLLSRAKFLQASVPKYRPGAAGVHALGRSLEAFRKWVVLDEPYLCTVEDALPVLATVLAIYRSAQTNQPEPVTPPTMWR